MTQPVAQRCRVTTDRKWDVAIVGAGPAGILAALELARAGLSVALLERDPWPRAKPCGGGLTGRALQQLPAGLQLPVEQHCHRVELNLLDCGLTFARVEPVPVVTMVMRRDFDAALGEMAVAHGATLFDDCRVSRAISGEHGVDLTTTHGSLRASLAILADGAFSPLARSLDWPDGRLAMPTLDWEVPADMATCARFRDTARFDFGVVPDGYAWVFPKKHHLSIGIGTIDGRRHCLPKLLQAHLDRLDIKPTAPVLRQGHTIPVTLRRGPFARQRLLLAGDAAGLTDPLTGEGLAFAMQSGRLAAAAILAGDLDPAAVAARYERLLREEILPELFYGRMLAMLLYRFPAWRRWIFSRRGDSLTRRMVEVMSGQTGYRQIFRHAPAWWRLLGIEKTNAR